MSDHPTLQSLLPFNSKLARLSIDKFPPLSQVRSQEFSFVCPSYREYKFHSHSGEGRLVMAMSLTNERVAEISDEARHAIFQCFLCGGCDVSVKLHSDIETVQGLYALRAESFRRAGPLPGHQALLERMHRVGHALPEDGSRGDSSRGDSSRGDWLRKAGVEPGMRGAPNLLFVGDRYALQKLHRQTLLNLIDLLQRGKVQFDVLGDEEPSTARVALDIGDEESFDRHAERVAAAIRASGAKRIVCADALDFNTLRAHVPKVADLGDVEVVHVVQVLDDLVRDNKLVPRRPLQARAAYHDPSTLGRLSEPYRPWNGEVKKVLHQLVVYDPPRPVNRGTHGIYDEPRRVLAAIPGIEMVEFERRREWAFCCADYGVLGAAGYDDFVRNTALHRMQEAKAVGAEMVASACPNSEDNLRAVAGEVGIGVASVVDLLHAAVLG
jgi:Fe-S oxidoreductase